MNLQELIAANDSIPVVYDEPTEWAINIAQIYKRLGFIFPVKSLSYIDDEPYIQVHYTDGTVKQVKAFNLSLIDGIKP